MVEESLEKQKSSLEKRVKDCQKLTQLLYIVFNIQMSVLALKVSFIFYMYSQQQIKLTQKSAYTPTSLPSPCLIRPTMPQSMILPLVSVSLLKCVSFPRLSLCS